MITNKPKIGLWIIGIFVVAIALQAAEVWEPQTATGPETNVWRRVVTYGDQWSRHNLAGHGGAYNLWRNGYNTYAGETSPEDYLVVSNDFYDAASIGTLKESVIAAATDTLTKALEAGSNLIGVSLEAETLAALLGDQLLPEDQIMLYDAVAQQYRTVTDLSTETVPAGGAFWLETSEARELVLTGAKLNAKSIVLLEGLQIIANPVAEDSELQSLGLSGTGNTNPGLCDKVSVIADGVYQFYGLDTNGIWYRADDKKVWRRKEEADELIEAGEGFWYDAQKPFIWNAE